METTVVEDVGPTNIISEYSNVAAVGSTPPSERELGSSCEGEIISSSTASTLFSYQNQSVNKKARISPEECGPKERLISASPQSPPTKHHALPSVNIYDALRSIKSNNVKPQDYLEPLRREAGAAAAAKAVKDLLGLRRQTIDKNRRDQSEAVGNSSSSRRRSPSTSGGDTSDKSSRPSRKRKGGELTKNEDLNRHGDSPRGGDLNKGFFDDPFDDGTSPRSKRIRHHKGDNGRSASNSEPLSSNYSVDGNRNDSSYSRRRHPQQQQRPREYSYYYHAPKVQDVPWFRFIGHRQPGCDIKLRAFHREERSKIEWTAAVEPHPSDQSILRFYKSLNFFERLHEEILALLTWADLTEWELKKRLEVVARVGMVAKSLWPGCQVISFGSFYTGLTLPSGDVDICIDNVPSSIRAADLVIQLVKALKKCRFTKNLIAITRARIPIAKFVDESSNIQVDISVNQPSATETSDLTRRKVFTTPILRPLIMTMKWLLTQLDLNETYQGGVGSYMLFTMCLAHLQAEMRARGHGFLQEANLGYLVYGFLERYTTFDYYFNGIDVRWEGSLFDKQEMHRDEAPQPLLCIKSPLEPELDVGKNSYKFAEVVDRFKWRLERLDTILEAERDLMRSKDAQSRGNLDSLRENSVLATIIRPDSREFYHRKLSSLHPYERDFSIFKQRPVPTIPPFLVQFVRRDMEQVLSRISRLVTDADYADSSYSSTTSFRARSHSTTRSYDIDGSTLANGKNGHRKPFTEMDHRRVVIEELAGLRESRSTSSRPQIFDAFVSNNFDNGAHKRGRQIIEVDDDEEEEDVQVLVQPPTTAPPPPPPPRQNMRHKGLDTVWKEIPSTHQIERWLQNEATE